MIGYIKKHYLFLLAVGAVYFAIYILFYQLGKNPFENWDESWYAEMTKQMIRSGNPFVLFWNGGAYFDKPPLLIWLNVFTVSLFGVSEFSCRLVSAIAALLTVFITSFFAFKKWGIIPSIFVYSSLILNSLFIWRGRSGNIDSLLTFLFVLSFLLINAKHTFKFRYFLLGIVFGLIFLTKLTIVLLPIGIFVLHEVFYFRKEINQRLRDYGLLFLVTILVPLFWLFGGYLHQGYAFVHYYLFNADQGVLSLSLSHFKFNYWYHSYYALQRRLFWFFLFGIGLLILRIKDRTNFLILLFSLSLLIQLSFTSRDNNWYLLPSMPFWSLAIGITICEILKFAEKYSHKLSLFVGSLLLIFIVAISYRTFSVNINALLYARISKSLVESSTYIRNNSRENETIIRLDESYPASIYYSDRKILSTATTGDKSGIMFITLDDLHQKLNNQEITWLYGSRDKVREFLDKNPEFPLGQISINEEEVILKRI
jgi:4-amino-4-deoxy-L-arabinose transferase-like glycosyltransferase